MKFEPNSLTRESHQIVETECDSKISEKCRIKWSGEYRYLMNTYELNKKVICMYCSRRTKSTGRNNPNCKYSNLDDNFFKSIDSEEKAYLLGWIASDGHISKAGFVISIHEKDKKILNKLRDIICPDLKIYSKAGHKHATMVAFNSNSFQQSKDLCKLFKINPGKKSDIVQFPELDNDELKWAFLRGYFDGDGCVSSYHTKKEYPRCSIASDSILMLEYIKKFSNIPCSISRSSIEWSGVNALDFLGKLYDCKDLALERKKELYLIWSSWIPTKYPGGKLDGFKWSKINKEAHKISKTRVSDSGYDLTLINKQETFGNVTLYGTGIKIRPAYGYCLNLVPRSSIIKKGYMLANGIGILDRSYIGEIKVALIKTDPNAPDLELPCKIMQLIPQLIQHFEVVEVDSFDETERSGGGFGSTDKK